MKKASLTLAAILFLAAGLIAAEAKTVKLKNGKTYTGEVTEVAGGYRIKAADGTVQMVLTGYVESIGPAINPDKEYKDRLSKIDPKNPDDHVAIAQWAYDANLPDIARKELKAALDLKKDHLKAQLLLKKVEAAIEEARQAQTQPVGPTPTPTGPSTRVGAADSLDKVLIPSEDIFRIRLQELTRKDDQVAIDFKNDLIERFINRQEGVDPDFPDKQASNRFRAMPRPAQALKIRKAFERDADALKWTNDILVKSDPKFMQEFRSKVWPVLRGHCATIECHGGEKGQGRLKYFIAPGNERTDYTNFVILDGYRNSDGRMFDRDNPEDSLLLQYGLPKEQAKFQHPQRPTGPAPQAQAYANNRVKEYRDVEAWIGSLRPTPHPDYNLTWKPPAPIRLNFGNASADLFKDTPSSAPAPAPHK